MCRCFCDFSRCLVTFFVKANINGKQFILTEGKKLQNKVG